MIIVFPVHALTLAEAVELARRNDPVFLSAQANASASHERSSQATANLLPQISATANTIDNRRTYEVRDVDLPPTEDRYNSNSAQLNLTQPLWRHANWIAGSQAEAAAAQADLQRVAAEQDLLVRLGQAWFDAMLARDVVTFCNSQVTATRQQWEQVRRAAALEMVSGVAAEEARSKYEQAVADQASAEADQMVKMAALEQIIGPADAFAAPVLSEKYAAADPRSGTLEQWLQHAEENSPQVLAAMRGVDAASDEVRKQRAGHEPTLDLVASYGRTSQQAGSFPGQNGFNIRQGTVGFQLNVPIYSGGGVSAKVGESVALREKALMDLESARRTVRQTCKQAWFGWQAGNTRQSAAQQSMRFATISLNAAIYGKSHDLKTEVDVLVARQQISSAIRDLQKSRYDMITSQLKLKASAGELQDADLTAFDAWLTSAEAKAEFTPEAGPFMPKAEQPVPSPAKPVPQTEPAGAAAPQPESAAPQPESAAPQPESAAPQPESAAPQPESAAPQLESAAPQPESAAPQPESAAPQPESAAPQPESAAPQPQAEGAAVQPQQAVSKPETAI
ncbi:MAG TPA: TolC family outer membrane protein [Gallionellaceae bacterium]|nr:TolC family outer membrane protein [Gallionellaceae bacterium]